MQTNKIDIAYALRLPPHRALEYLRSLGMKLDDKFAGQALMRAREKAFTVSAINNARVVDHLYQEIIGTLERGETPASFVARMKPSLAKMGYYSEDIPAYRLKQMVRGSMQTAYNAGRYNAQVTNIESQPWWIRIEIDDNRLRPTHDAVNYVTARADDAYWDNNYPPYLDGEMEWGCRGRVRAVSEKRLEALMKSNPRIRIISTGMNSKKNAINDDTQIKQDGINSIQNKMIQSILKGKLNV